LQQHYNIMPHKTLSEPLSPDISKSAPNVFDSDSLKVRRTSNSLSGLSPGSRLSHSKSISIQDLVGGEKKATNIHSESIGTSKASLLSVESAPTVVHAEDKIQNIIEARKKRERRRSDISKSLDKSTMLLVGNSPKLSNNAISDIPDDEENFSIPLNDIDNSHETTEKEARRRRRRSSGGGSKGSSPSRRMSDASRDQRLRMIKNLESYNLKKSPKSLTKAAAFSPKSPGMRRSISANSLKERLRQRLQGVNYCDLDGSDTSDTEEGSTSVGRKGATINDGGSGEFSVDGSDAGIENQTRSKSKERARSKSRNRISKKYTDAEDGAETLKKPRSKSKNKVRSKSKTKRRHRREDIETEDETSINSNSLSGRRGGRRPSALAVSDDNTDEGELCVSRSSKIISSTGQSPQLSSGSKSVSRNPDLKNKPLDASNSSTKSKKRTKTKKNAAQNSVDSGPSLGSLLDSAPSLKRSTDHDDLSQFTEDQTIVAQKFLLQFDPTNKNHVRSVDQENAKKSSEIIHGLHGTKSTLEISELAGLPTFERPSYNVKPSRSISLDPDPAQFLGTRFPDEDPDEASRNAQWDYGGSHSSRQSRSIASVGKNIFFNKKGKVDGEKHHKPARRSSDIGARTNSFGAMMRLGGRHKFRDYDGGFGDNESLLKH